MTPSELLGPAGPLAQRLPGFTLRPEQQAMADAVGAALCSGQTLIAEAGTGTGKTYAYLVPVLLYQKKVIISTGTRHLQDQLFHRDLPEVRAALKSPVQVALLKGRSNYVCRHRLQRTEQGGEVWPPEEARSLQQISEWARRTRSGDIAEMETVPEEAALWAQVTSTRDNCLGQDCLQYGECFVLKARRAAQEAEVVIVNHHLLLADMLLKEEGFGDLLPGAEAVIVDEAHQLPQVADRFFGLSLSGRQFGELVRDVLAEQAREAGDMPDLKPIAEALARAASALRPSLGAASRRAAWATLPELAAVHVHMASLQQALASLEDVLRVAAERGQGLKRCLNRCAELRQRLVLFQDAEEDQIRWLETHARGYVLHLTPFHVGPLLQHHTRRYRAAWVYTSATLAVGEDFTHFRSSLGLSADDVATVRWDSPFDYQRNALLYLPGGLPRPADADYHDAVVEAALPVLAASRGRAFMLFTSHRALKAAAARLAGRLALPLLIQGKAPKRDLLERFRRLGNAVLLGTGGFWEGVDVRGEALSVVIIDKLPFAPPDDPLWQARAEALQGRGENPFLADMLPAAVIALKQGVGRLLRDARDRGVLMLCDPRLRTRGYGKAFLRALPPMATTDRLADVEAFFRKDPASGVPPA